MSALCQVLTELGIEAEICSEMLVAVERLSRESYDAILVDWEQETEATFLLKTAREQKVGQALNLALVQSDKEVSKALQQGANSVIKKPIDLRLAQETLSTARDLILSRRTEQRGKEARLAAAQAELSANTPDHPPEEPSTAKTGFLTQTAPRSAFDAQAQTTGPDASNDSNPQWQAARGPEALLDDRAHIQEIRPSEKNHRDEAKPPAQLQETPVEESAVVPPLQSDDSTGVFSSLPEEQETASEPRPRPHSRLGFVLIACMLIAGVLYVWAPGDSYGGRLTSLFHIFSPATDSHPAPAPSVTTAPADEAAKASGTSAKAEDLLADSSPAVTADVDPSKIQIIEAKAIPKAGAQLPPSTDPMLGSDQAQTPTDVANTSMPVADSSSQAARPAQAAPELSSTIAQQPKALVLPVAPSRPTVPMPTAENNHSTFDGESGVIIPDSLKTTPSSAPGSSLDSSVVPEATSRELVINRIEPDYPAQAVQQHFEGPVVLQVWVAKDGSIRDLKLVKGYFVLGRAAFEAVKQWRFKPYSPNGKPIDFQTYVTVNFKAPS